MRAMSRAKRGSGFRGVLNYALEREGKAQKGLIIGGNMSGSSPRELAAEFGAVRKLRPDIVKPVSHNSLRLPAGEKLTAEQWRVVGDDFMREMGFTDAHQYVYVLHDDADGQHIHVIANRVSENGSVWLGKNENLAATKICDKLEREYKLSVTTPDKNDKETQEQIKTRRPTAKEIQQTKRTGKQSPRSQIQKIIDKSLKNGITIEVLTRELEANGVTVYPNIASTGKLNGFSFELDGVRFKGSDLGKSYTLNGLQKRGLNTAQSDIEKEELKVYGKVQRIQKSYSNKALTARDKNSLHGMSGGHVVSTGDGVKMLLHKGAHDSVGSGSAGDSRVRRANNSNRRTKSKSKGLKVNGLYNDNLVTDAERRKLEAIELENYRSWVQPNGKIRYTNKSTGETIEDQGNRIEVNGTDYETLARDAVALAIAKGWKLEDLKPCGEKSFVEAVKAEVERLKNPNAITTIEEALAEVEAINKELSEKSAAKEEAVEVENQTTFEELESREYDEDEGEEEDTKPLKEFVTVHSTGHIYEYGIFTDAEQTDGVIRMFDKMDGEVILEGSVTKIGRDQYEAGKNYQEDGKIKYVFFKNGKEISKDKYIAQTKTSKSAAAADFLDKNPVNSDLDRVLKKGIADGHKLQNLALEFIKRQTVGANEEKSQEIVKQVQAVCEDVQNELNDPKENQNQNQSQTRELKL